MSERKGEVGSVSSERERERERDRYFLEDFCLLFVGFDVNFWACEER